MQQAELPGGKVTQCGPFVPSSGTGHVIKSPLWSPLVPKLPSSSQFYISRTFRAHICSSSVFRLHSCHLSAGPGFGISICCFAAWHGLPQGLTLQSRGSSLSLHPGPRPSSDPEPRLRGGSPEPQGRHRVSAHRAPSRPPQHNPFMSQKWKSLWNPVFSLLQSS